MTEKRSLFWVKGQAERLRENLARVARGDDEPCVFRPDKILRLVEHAESNRVNNLGKRRQQFQAAADAGESVSTKDVNDTLDVIIRKSARMVDKTLK